MTGEIEIRAAEVASVSYPQRLVTLVVMPYETETTIVEGGREFVEVVTRGAFDGIQVKNGHRLARIVPLNRDHQETRTIGQATAFHPDRPEGLVADVHISRTVLGEETLELANDGVLGASAGFALLRKNGRTGPPVPDAEVWETRSRRRLNRLYLDHIALTPTPAYAGATPVLAVRADAEPAMAAAAGTPNRDRLTLDLWGEMAAELDRRYGLSR
jgi:phage head maturation protease